MNLLQRTIEDSVATLHRLAPLEAPLNRAAALVSRCLTSGHKLLICGNGGSASEATHLATEFLCRFVEDRRPYPAISLTANNRHAARSPCRASIAAMRGMLTMSVPIP
jgi:D-sedoheptulose 7-phosphate isomerase